MRDCCYLRWCFCFDGGGRCGDWSGGIGQSFLVLNKFSEVDPALGQGLLCLTGALSMSSSDGGLEFWVRGCPSFWGLVVRQGTSANCPVANLYTIASMEVVDLITGVWVEIAATMEEGAVEFTGAVGVAATSRASTITFYFLLGSTVFFLCHLPWVLGPFYSCVWCLVGLIMAWFVVDGFGVGV